MARAYAPGVRHRHPPTAAGREAMQAALAALYGAGEPLAPNDALALEEQLRRDADDHARRQGELHLVERGRG